MDDGGGGAVPEVTSCVLATGGYDHQIRLWRVDNGSSYRTFQHSDSVSMHSRAHRECRECSEHIEYRESTGRVHKGVAQKVKRVQRVHRRYREKTKK